MAKSVSIRIEGVDKLVKKLGVAGSKKVLKKPMQQSLRILESDIADYPDKPAGSTYDRTGILGKKWTVKTTNVANGIRGVVGNRTDYAPWVQSHLFQTRAHRRTGWPTDKKVIDQNRKRIVELFNKAIKEAIK